MTWYAHSGPRRSETGKFRSQAKLGTEKSAGGTYRDWFYSFVAHQTGSGVRRTRFAVSIRDPHKNRVAYLRDFSCLNLATVAAEQWIDQQLTHDRTEPRLGSTPLFGEVGTIPPLPSATDNTQQVNSGKIADGIAEEL